jgi:glycosyltransferase involved in cell wall biosynthesis
MGRAAPRVLALTGDETGSMMWRIWQPYAELRSRGFVAHSVPTKESEQFLPLLANGYYDAIVTPRIAWPDNAGLPWRSAVRKAGICWVYEVDDDVYSPSIVGRQYRIFPKEHAKGLEGLERDRLDRIAVLQQCDAITVTGQRLATIVRMHAPEETPVYVVPNAIDARWFRSTLRGIKRLPELEGKLTIGWCGGTRDLEDLNDVAAAWKIIAERYPDVHFVVQGFIPAVLDEAVPAHRRSTLPWLELVEYPRGLLNIDIGCCAVAPTVFNTAKSCIKWYEFTLAGAPCVVSETLYGREVTDGQDGLVARNVFEWVQNLSLLIEDESVRRRMADNARTTVMTHHSLDNNWWNWPEAYALAVDHFREKQARTLVLAKS